jgi:hypothetical protein
MRPRAYWAEFALTIPSRPIDCVRQWGWRGGNVKERFGVWVMVLNRFRARARVSA